MQQVFIYFLDKSITSIAIIGIVLAARMALGKVPKVFSYFLWVIVFLRLFLPPFIHDKCAGLPVHLVKIKISGSNAIAAQTHLGAGGITVINVLALIWAVTAIGIFVYTAASYLKLNYKLRGAVPLGNGMYESNQLKTPFVLGLIKPRIYLPAVLKERQRDFVVLHEKVHIKRKDYLIKTAAWLVVILHWYNPLVWCAYRFMCRDMEMSCDEAVISKLNHPDKTKYAVVLLSLSAEQGLLIPVGFCKNDVKERIENIMKMKKTSIAVTMIALLGIAFLGVFLFTAKTGESTATVNTQTLMVRQEPSTDSEVVGMLPEFGRVKILEEAENDFVKIEFENGSAYVMKEFITIE